MSTSEGENRTHNIAVRTAEAIRQAAVSPTATRAVVLAAEIAFYRSCLASAIANGASPAQYETALKELGTM